MPIHLLFGRTRWSRRRGVGALLRGQRDVAYVTGTWRKREQLVRELSVTPTGVLRFAEPDAWVLAHLVDELCRRFADDRAAHSAGAQVAAAWRLLRERPDPTFGDDLQTARELCEVSAAFAGSGTLPSDPRVRDLVLRLRARLDASPAHRRPEERWRRVTEALLAPSPALRRWLARHRAVVIDDLTGLTARECAAVVTLCRAFSEAGAIVILSFAIGRDRGGREVTLALGVEPPDDRESLVFEATRTLRHQAFDALVASGEAELWVSGPLGLRAVDPGVDDEGPGGVPDLADHVSAGLPMAALLPAGGVTAGAFSAPAGEVEWVARTLVGLLHDGVDPRDCLVALGSPGHDPLVERIFDDHALPWERGGGRPLGPVPAVRALRAVLGLAQDGFPLDDVLDFVAFVAGAPAALGARVRAAGIRGGHPREWTAALETWARRVGIDPAALEAERARHAAAVDALPPQDPASAGVWRSRLRAGAAPILARCVPEVADALEAAQDAVCADLRAADPGDWEAPVVRQLLDLALAEVTVTPPADGVRRVPVVGVREILGLTPRHTFLLGLSAGTWPAPRGRSFLLSSEEALPLRDPLAEARYLLHSLLRDAVSEPWMRGVHLSWPETRDGAPVRPSPVLAEVLDARVGAGRLRECIAPPPAPAVTSQSGERAAAAWSEARRGALPAEGRASADRAVAVAVARQGPLGPYDGLLGSPIPPPGSVPVTAFETWLACPHRYWVRHRLGLDPLLADDAELEPRRRGTALHRVLEEFLRARDLRPLAGDPDRAGARRSLHAVASRVLDAIEAEGGFDPLFHGYARDRWLAGLVDERPAGLFRAWLDQELDRVGPAPVAVERSFRDLRVGPIALRGTLDRLDALPGGAHLVVDYKTGRPPTRDQVASGLSLQPFAYLATVEGPAASCFQTLSKPDRLARTGFVGDAAALDAACTPAERRVARVVTAAERRQVLDAAGASAEALLRGAFPPTRLAPPVAGCPTCPFRHACRRDLRHAGP